jgi:hypothetical protein
MFTVLVSLVGAALSFFKTQQNLAVENLALRHQIGILKRTLGKRRVRFKPSDRRLWVMLFRLWSGWQRALAIVQPATVIRWHREGFRRFWTRKSRRGDGRPALERELQTLIRKMSIANVTWRAPRIRNELAKIGITVSRSTVAKYMVRHRKPQCHLQPQRSVDGATGRADLPGRDCATLPPQRPGRDLWQVLSTACPQSRHRRSADRREVALAKSIRRTADRCTAPFGRSLALLGP